MFCICGGKNKKKTCQPFRGQIVLKKSHLVPESSTLFSAVEVHFPLSSNLPVHHNQSLLCFFTTLSHPSLILTQPSLFGFSLFSPSVAVAMDGKSEYRMRATYRNTKYFTFSMRLLLVLLLCCLLWQKSHLARWNEKHIKDITALSGIIWSSLIFVRKSWVYSNKTQLFLAISISSAETAHLFGSGVLAKEWNYRLQQTHQQWWVYWL